MARVYNIPLSLSVGFSTQFPIKKVSSEELCQTSYLQNPQVNNVTWQPRISLQRALNQSSTADTQTFPRHLRE